MAVNLRLTEEQASWLRTVLEKRQTDQHWARGPVDPDDHEHTATVLQKLKSGRGRNSWDGPESR